MTPSFWFSALYANSNPKGLSEPGELLGDVWQPVFHFFQKGQDLKSCKPGVVTGTCNPNTGQVEGKGLGMQVQS